jgi:uncharacterized protein (DUF952 family)
MPLIYHITTATAWKEALGKGHYESPALPVEGFIHCAQEGQVAGVLERYFQGKNDLVKLVIDTDRLKSPFIYEWSPSIADTFPHIYGPVNLDAVMETVAV